VLLREGKAAKARGQTPDQAKDEIMPGLHDLMRQITGDDAGRNAAFKQQLVDWYLHRVFEELDGPLTDAIGAIPISRSLGISAERTGHSIWWPAI